MNIRSIKLACFSPTGTTRTVLSAIARGLELPSQHVDITSPAARLSPLVAGDDELLVIGVPVYMGRVPDLLSGWFRALTLHQTPVVCVVVYGNRAYENALLELRDRVAEHGGIPVAAAAFIGEHSFSSAELPASVGRPDSRDLQQAEDFGRRVAERLNATAGFAPDHPLAVPGTLPYGGVTKLWDVDFIEVADGCVQCGACAAHCPAGAIDATNSASIDVVKCITCCGCIKLCPTQSRSKKPGPVMEASRRIHTLFPQPKQPEFFLPESAA
jgi:ferredoxin